MSEIVAPGVESVCKVDDGIAEGAGGPVEGVEESVEGTEDPVA